MRIKNAGDYRTTLWLLEAEGLGHWAIGDNDKFDFVISDDKIQKALELLRIKHTAGYNLFSQVIRNTK